VAPSLVKSVLIEVVGAEASLASVFALALILASPKSRILACPRSVTKNIGRLHVSMNDAFGVGRVKSVCNLYRQAQQNLVLDGPSADAMLQRHPIEKFHGDEQLRPAGHRFRESCRCWDGSAQKQPWLRAGSGLRSEGLWPRRRAET
jgi:hypothetical protein